MTVRNTVTASKRTVRDRLLSGRQSMPRPDRETADRATWNALRDFLNEHLKEGATVAAYRPFGAEPGATLVPELPERLSETYRVLLPVTLPDNDLDWTVLGSKPLDGERSTMALTGPKGTEELATTCGPEAVEQAAAVIVPALGVTGAGLRLGRGGGCYDRALARVAAGVPVVALLRDGEIGVEIPAEAHDRSVTAVVTPAEGLVTLA